MQPPLIVEQIPPTMGTEDLIKLPASGNSRHGSENDDASESGRDASKLDPLPVSSEVIEEIFGEAPGAMSDVLDENMDTLMEDDFEKDEDSNAPGPPLGFELTNSVAEVEKNASISSVHTENRSLSVQNEISLRSCKKNETLTSKREVDANSLSGNKRPRMTADEQQPSVHVTYSSLPRESKQKLEKLLLQWSEWHSQWCSSTDDTNVVLESGEETYFPALRVGLDKPSAVTFWVDNQTKMQSSKEFIPLDGTSIPLYDRGYSLALTSSDGSSGLDGGAGKLDTARCFNCGSYNHAMKDCPKPRNSVAVNNARKEHKSKRNQHANSRNSTRYYQSSRGGKYDGLTPGILDAETRQLLGLGELDPPPWLNRMREIGYPPGYLDADIEDQPSGITIFGDEENKEQSEEGEILGGSYIEPSRKMTVEFPGINAPIPENADERLWAPSSSSFNASRYGSDYRYNNSSESSGRGYCSEQRWSRDDSSGRGYYSEQRWSRDESYGRGYYTEQRWSRDLEDDGPPGCDLGTSPSLANHYRIHGDPESGYYSLSPRASPSTHWSSSYSRSLSDRGRRPPGRDGSFPYSSPR